MLIIFIHVFFFVSNACTIKTYYMHANSFLNVWCVEIIITVINRIFSLVCVRSYIFCHISRYFCGLIFGNSSAFNHGLLETSRNYLFQVGHDSTKSNKALSFRGHCFLKHIKKYVLLFVTLISHTSVFIVIYLFYMLLFQEGRAFLTRRLFEWDQMLHLFMVLCCE